MQFRFSFFFVIFLTTDIYSQPNPRHLEEITYDKAGNKLLLFGGSEMKKDGWTEPVILYEWNGKNWQSKEAKGPLGRRGHVWIHDESQRQTLLMGGVTTGQINKDSLLFDVWTWDGKNWKLLNTTCPVKEPEAVFDPVHNRVLVYGDANNKDQGNYNLSAAFELWEYKNDTWKKLSTSGPDITGSRMIAFDSERKRLVVPVFEQNRLTVWEWTGKEWLKKVVEREGPVYRTRFALAYDPVGKTTVLFGGLSVDRIQLGDCWKWDGQKWKEVAVKNGPTARNSAHFATGTDQLFLFGGSVPKKAPDKGLELSNELWVWRNDEWIKK